MFYNARQLILKITRGCNLRCTYCYIKDKEENEENFMTTEVLIYTLDRWLREVDAQPVSPEIWDDFINSDPDKDVENSKKYEDVDDLSIVFHGGEALSIGKETFMHFCRIIKEKSREYSKPVSISIQTNGTLIDEEWMGIFRRYKIIPGISFDGLYFDEAHPRGSQSKLLENLVKMKANKFNFSLLMVLTKANYKYIIENLKVIQALGVNSIKINRGVDTARAENSPFELTADELLLTAEKIMLYMFSNPEFSDDVLAKNMRMFLDPYSPGLGKDRGASCYTKWCGSGNSLVEIEPNGDVLFCGKSNSFDEKETIYDKDVGGILHQTKAWKFHSQKIESVRERDCWSCAANAICDYGCLTYSNQKFGKRIIDDTSCDYSKGLYKLFNKYSREIETYTKRTSLNEHYSKYFL